MAVLTVEAVAANHVVWEGEATFVRARTTEGDIGVMADHEPFLAALVPGVAKIEAADGSVAWVKIDGGFISVEENRVSLLSQYAELTEEPK
ncbi:MAG: F0F1 ATP synthase subunit epsilon [Propionibacteriaceae bacterium]|jgi:F-type H+-transporting ATPase subunit epsilon|nr:F0F1 ATP synthase subunit epsilon [Propionibacteriaceae bacterium]